MNRFVRALAFLTAAWLVVLCLKGATLLYGAPPIVADLAKWLAWLTYPPAGLEVLVSGLLMAMYRPREVNRAIQYAPPTRIQNTRWLLYGVVITPLALVWVA